MHNPPTFTWRAHNQKYLAGSARRPQLRSSVIWVFILCAPIIVVSTIPFFFAAWNSWANWNTLRSSGVVTEATLTQRYIDESGDSDAYHLMFVYDAPFFGDLRSYNGEATVSEDEYNRSEIGGTITVVYAPDNPQIVRLAGREGFWEGVGFTLGALAFSLASIGLIIGGATMMRRDNRLRRQGQLIYGVLRSVDSNTDSEGALSVTLRYEFTAPNGQLMQHTVAETRDDLDQATLPQVGERVAVLYADKETFRLL
jgi:type IV secretory pathway VirB2 component (pilin)